MVFLACQPRAASGMSRSAATRSCSTITVSALARLQRGGRLGAAERTNQQLLGRIPLRFAAARRTMKLRLGRDDGRRRHQHLALNRAIALSPTLLQELGDLRARDAPLRSDSLALQIASFKARDHVGL